MGNSRKFSALLAKMSPESQACVEQESAKLLAAMEDSADRGSAQPAIPADGPR